MPKKRPPYEAWKEIRKQIWLRDNKSCTHCKKHVELEECHIDHIISGKLGTNKFSNLRTLCRRCHVLRLDNRHRGMIAKALKDGIIPPNWREYIWKD